MADQLVHKINDATDAVADAKAMVWAMFYMAEGMRQADLSNALTGCCNQALLRLNAGSKILEEVSAAERAKWAQP
jgi:hypothetical protein